MVYPMKLLELLEHTKTEKDSIEYLMVNGIIED